MKKLYQKNKDAKVGEKCICPSCSTVFTKTNYQQAFCKSKDGTQCKDKYWNTITPSKYNNTTRISPRNKAYYDETICKYDAGLECLGLDYLLDCGDR
jgi:hypothetical protein